ncbi:hypothetical protein NQ317_007640 [Molorchus minor]|uniref:PID domain-containing protein n=1 Tax=Molorchus minor TaxID=1323400 RepID=A0ABQ9ITR3_9CUCU|nr:hypothetical protein NQ317_007640 [Molorchus minor]
MSDKEEPVITVDDLPMTFTVKYLGNHPAKGLWGMKHTRKPVDYLVSQAKNLPPNIILQTVQIQITKDGVAYTELTGKKTQIGNGKLPGGRHLLRSPGPGVHHVTEDNLNNGIPFICHSFVCDSRDQARKITYALAAAFQDYGRRVKEENKDSDKPIKRFAIDLRTPEEQAEASDGETDA